MELAPTLSSVCTDIICLSGPTNITQHCQVNTIAKDGGIGEAKEGPVIVVEVQYSAIPLPHFNTVILQTGNPKGDDPHVLLLHILVPVISLEVLFYIHGGRPATSLCC
jgi:hypothetical protein